MDDVQRMLSLALVELADQPLEEAMALKVAVAICRAQEAAAEAAGEVLAARQWNAIADLCAGRRITLRQVAMAQEIA